MVSLSNHSGIFDLPFDKLRASGEKDFFSLLNDLIILICLHILTGVEYTDER